MSNANKIILDLLKVDTSRLVLPSMTPGGEDRMYTTQEDYGYVYNYFVKGLQALPFCPVTCTQDKMVEIISLFCRSYMTSIHAVEDLRILEEQQKGFKALGAFQDV